MVEGTPLLREHAVMSCIEGSNPSASANQNEASEEKSSGAFLMGACLEGSGEASQPVVVLEPSVRTGTAQDWRHALRDAGRPYTSWFDASGAECPRGIDARTNKIVPGEGIPC